VCWCADVMDDDSQCKAVGTREQPMDPCASLVCSFLSSCLIQIWFFMPGTCIENKGAALWKPFRTLRVGSLASLHYCC
jgi:hypothetical protein